MTPDERDTLATATAEQLRARGFDVGNGFADCVNPGDEWCEVIRDRRAAERQRRAVSALGALTRDDVAALLEALADE